MQLMQLCATRTNRTCSVLLLLGMSLAFSLPAGGTTLIRMGTKDLTQKADAIFYGVCEAVEQAWDFRKTKIHTKARYTVREVVKGSLGAEVTVTAARRQDAAIIDAVGPEILTFNDLVQQIARAVGSKAWIVHLPPYVAVIVARIIGWFLGDVTLTRPEAEGLMANLLVSDKLPTGQTRFTDWLAASAGTLGIRYASEMAKHFR